MGLRYETISFLSDFGNADEFVGVVHSVIRTIAPEVAVVDVTHQVPPFDVRAGSLALARSAPYLAPGVVLAVVDPGVGTTRRAIAVEVGDGQSVLVGPDNGLLAPAVAMVGGATHAVELTSEHYRLSAPGATFDGRDVFAPAAAHLCNGVALDDLGPAVSPAGLYPGLIPVVREEGDDLVAEVLWVDRFGNAQLNVGPDDVADWGDKIQARIGAAEGSAVRTAHVAAAFAELGTGQLGLLVDSSGLLALALDRTSVADELGLAAGTEVTLTRLADQDQVGGVATPVRLGRTTRVEARR